MLCMDSRKYLGQDCMQRAATCRQGSVRESCGRISASTATDHCRSAHAFHRVQGIIGRKFDTIGLMGKYARRCLPFVHLPEVCLTFGMRTNIRVMLRSTDREEALPSAWMLSGQVSLQILPPNKCVPNEQQGHAFKKQGKM